MTAVEYTERFDTPSSVAIHCIWYDEDTENLYLQFKNGTFAGYTGVPVECFEGFKKTDSVGRYYNREFARNNFTGATLPQSPEMEKRTNTVAVPNTYLVSVMVTIEGAATPGDAVNTVADAVKEAGLKVDRVRVQVVE